MKRIRESKRVCISFLIGMATFSVAGFAFTIESSGAGLTVLSSYESPKGVYHALLKNRGAKRIEIHSVEVYQAPDHGSVETRWIRIDPKVMQPGQWTHFYFKTKRDDLDCNLFRAAFKTPDRESALDMPMAPSEIDVTYAVRDSSSTKFYFYLRNNIDFIIYVTAMRVNDIALTNSAASLPLELAPRKKGLVCGHLDGLQVPAGAALPADIELETTGGAVHRFAYLFSEKRFEVKRSESPVLMACPAHAHGTYEQAAEKLFRLADAARAGARCVHICRSSFLEGINVFGQCIEEMRVNPQASNPERRTERWLKGLLDTTSKCKGCSEPGIFSVVIEAYSSLLGAQHTDTMGGAELREVVYSEIACGAKGIQFRLPKEEISTQYRTNAENTAAELTMLSECLAVSEPVDLVVSCSTDSIIPKTLLCGDQGLILILLRRNAEESEEVAPFDVVLNSPDWLKPTEFLEVGGASTKGTLVQSERGVRLTVQGLGSVGVYALPASRGVTTDSGNP